jgi:hypothetical protein
VNEQMSVSFNGFSTRPARRLADLTDAVRGVVAAHADWVTTARLVTEKLRTHLPAPDLLPAEQRRGSPESYVDGFAPPGDIHRIRNNTETTAISIHVYGTDVARLGGSARRYYD